MPIRAEGRKITGTVDVDESEIYRQFKEIDPSSYLLTNSELTYADMALTNDSILANVSGEITPFKKPFFERKAVVYAESFGTGLLLGPPGILVAAILHKGDNAVLIFASGGCVVMSVFACIQIYAIMGVFNNTLGSVY